MSVPSYKRNESKAEHLRNFKKLRKETNKLLMRDFGIKSRSYSVDLISKIYKPEEEDLKTLSSIYEKYGMSSAMVDKYPKWMIDAWRSKALNTISALGTEIELANSITITNSSEYEERRLHWTRAIGYCHTLKDLLHEILDCVNGVKMGQYTEIAKCLEREIILIKKVRKRDCKFNPNKNKD